MRIVGSVWCGDGGVTFSGVFGDPQMLQYGQQVPKFSSFPCEERDACERCVWVSELSQFDISENTLGLAPRILRVDVCKDRSHRIDRLANG